MWRQGETDWIGITERVAQLSYLRGLYAGLIAAKSETVEEPKPASARTAEFIEWIHERNEEQQRFIESLIRKPKK